MIWQWCFRKTGYLLFTAAGKTFSAQFALNEDHVTLKKEQDLKMKFQNLQGELKRVSQLRDSKA